MTCKRPIPSLLLTGLLATTLNAAAQETSVDGAAQATVTTQTQATVDTAVAAEQLAARYADAAGSTEAAAELVAQLRSGAATGVAMGYGEIDTALALASAQVASGAATDLDAALGHAMQMRADGMAWGAIAQQSGVNLGEAVSVAHRAGTAIDAQAHGGTGAGLSAVDQAQSRASGLLGAAADTAVDAVATGAANARGALGTGMGADARIKAGVDARGSAASRPARAGVEAGIGIDAGIGIGAPARPERPQRPERPVSVGDLLGGSLL